MKGVNVTRPTNSQTLIEVFKQFLKVYTHLYVTVSNCSYVIQNIEYYCTEY